MSARNRILAAVATLAGACSLLGAGAVAPAATAVCGTSISLSPASATWRTWNDHAFKTTITASGADDGLYDWQLTDYNTPSEVTITHGGGIGPVGTIAAIPTGASPIQAGKYTIALIVYSYTHYGENCPVDAEGHYTLIVADWKLYSSAVKTARQADQDLARVSLALSGKVSKAKRRQIEHLYADAVDQIGTATSAVRGMLSTDPDAATLGAAAEEVRRTASELAIEQPVVDKLTSATGPLRASKSVRRDIVAAAQQAGRAWKRIFLYQFDF